MAASLPFLQGWMDEAGDVGHTVGFLEPGTGSEFPKVAVSQVSSPTMLNQELPMSCAPAACTQYLRDRGINVSEEELRNYLITSERGTTPDLVSPGLRGFLNSRGISDIQIVGRYNPHPDGDTVETLHQLLEEHGSIVVMIGSPSSRGGVELHMVIVDQLNDNLVTIRNPWGISGPGSGMGTIETYKVSDFLKFWSGGIGTAWWTQ